MADSKLTALTEDTAPTSDDLVYTVTDPGGTPASRKATLTNLGKGISPAWTSWSPTLSGRFTDADWTKSGGYQQVGKTVRFRLSLVAADATPMAGGSGEGTVALPVTSISYAGTATAQPIGIMQIFDASTSNRFNGYCYWASTTTMALKWWQVSGTAISNAAIDSTNPMTWTTSDEIFIQGSFEAA